MYNDIVNKPIVLALNRNWQPIGHTSVKKAFVAMSGGNEENPAALGLDISYAQLENGEWDFSAPTNMTALMLDAWMEIPVRECDFAIHTAKRTIRVPTVIISANFTNIPHIEKKANRKNVAERDQFLCQYSGRKLTRHTMTIDHIIPKSRGGRDTWENLVACHKDINSFKDDRTPEEAGLKLLRRPLAPKAVPASVSIREIAHRDWAHFLIRQQP